MRDYFYYRVISHFYCSSHIVNEKYIKKGEDNYMSLYESMGLSKDSYQIIKDSVEQIKGMTFEYLCQAQTDKIGLEKILIEPDMIHLYPGKEYVKISFRNEFINYDNRHMFFRSKFYKKNITLKDIAENPEIFNKFPLLVIESIIHMDYTIFLDEDRFEITIPIYSGDITGYNYNEKNIKRSVFENYKNPHYPQTIHMIFIPNTNISYFVDYDFDDIRSKYMTGVPLYKRNIQSATDKNRFGLFIRQLYLKCAKPTYPMFAQFVKHIDYDNEFGYDLPPATNSMGYKDIPTGDVIYCGSENIHSVIFLDKKDTSYFPEYFSLQMESLPHSSFNFLTFFRPPGGDDWGWKYHAGVYYDHYYPNIFKINRHNPDHAYAIVVYYTNKINIPDNVKQYIDELNLYRKIFGWWNESRPLTQEEATKFESIHTNIINYKPVGKDQTKQVLPDISTSQLQYDDYVARMKNIVAQYPFYHEIYNSKYLRNYYGYYIRLQDLTDEEWNKSIYTYTDKDDGAQYQFFKFHINIAMNFADYEIYIDGRLHQFYPLNFPLMRNALYVNIHADEPDPGEDITDDILKENNPASKLTFFVPIDFIQRDKTVIELNREYESNLSCMQLNLSGSIPDIPSVFEVKNNTDIISIVPPVYKKYSKGYKYSHSQFNIFLHNSEITNDLKPLISEGLSISEDSYEIFQKENGQWVKANRYFAYDDIGIRFKNVPRPFEIYVYDILYRSDLFDTHDNVIKFDGQKINTSQLLYPINNNKYITRYRSFREGRLVSKPSFEAKYPDNYKIKIKSIKDMIDLPKTDLTLRVNKNNPDDKICVVKSSIKRQLLVYIKDLKIYNTTTGKKGYIDFTKYPDFNGKGLPFPFNFKTYDLYVNGFKAHPWNVDILSPNKIIIKGIDSTINIVLYLRNAELNDRVVEANQLDKDMSDKYKTEVDEYINKNYNDIVDNHTDTDLIDEYNIIAVLKHFFSKWDMINPDINQLIPKEEYLMFSDKVFNAEGDIIINEHPKDHNDIFINADEAK